MIYKEPFTYKIVSEDDYDELMADYYGMFENKSTFKDAYESPKTFGSNDLIYKPKVTEPSIDYRVTDKPMDKQVGGSHYKDMKIQPITFIQANGLGFCEGNAIKYLCRYKDKGGIEDLKKAKHYIELLIEEYKDA